jgi:alpha-amylase
MKSLQKSIPILLFIVILVSCAAPTPTVVPTSIPTTEPTATPDPYAGTDGFRWWNDTVFYEIFVRSFRDSDGDGIGDFNGIIEKLDYLEGLGVKGIWLMPIHPSPSYHGYDVTDYYAVNPDYGTMDDFKRLLEEAHERGIRDHHRLRHEPHQFSRHPWFQSALTPGSQYREWYVWSETDPGTLGPWGAKAWYRAGNGQYYYAIFWDQMPDLNYENPAVREEMKKVTSFWLEEVGVDGFRLDAVRYVVEGDQLADSKANHAFLEEWGEYYRNINPQAFSVGEAWTDNVNVRKYTIRTANSTPPSTSTSPRHGTLSQGNTTSFRFVLQTTIRDFPDQDNANFLTNHDMPRVMNVLGVDKEQKARLAAGILLTVPGIPFIYYGEEIGMSGTKPDELIRTPMQWEDEPGAGFTDGTPWQPVNSDLATVNVAGQAGDPDSLLETYRTFIQLRNERSALRVGKTYVAESNSNKVVAYLRASSDETILVLFQHRRRAFERLQLDLSIGPLSGQYTAQSLLDESTISPLTANDNGGFDDYVPLSELPPYSIFVIQLTK